MKDREADIAIGVLNKLIDQELEAVRAATRDGNTPFVGYAQTRHNAFLYARDEIRKALAAAVDERGAGNPFLPQRDELVTQDMHTCDLCGRWCSSPVYSIGRIYGGQAKTFTEVCADCMWRLKFSPVRTISLDAYRLFEQWRLSNRRPTNERPDSASVPERSRHSHLRQQWHRTIPGCRPAYRALRHLRQVVEDLRRLAVPDHLGRSASLDDLAVLAQNLEDRP